MRFKSYPVSVKLVEKTPLTIFGEAHIEMVTTGFALQAGRGVLQNRLTKPFGMLRNKFKMYGYNKHCAANPSIRNLHILMLFLRLHETAEQCAVQILSLAAC